MRALTVILFFVIGCSPGVEELEPRPNDPLPPNVSIGKLEEGLVQGDWVVQGVVTTSDSCGNFYQSLLIDEPTGVLELNFSFYDTYSLFHQGDLISVRLFDRVIRRENGLLSVAMGTPTVVAETVLRQGLRKPVTPKVVRIAEIDSSLLGRFVEIRNGEFDMAERSTWSGEQKFTVGSSSITVYTSAYASYANEILPLGQISLRGIVTIYKGKFQLKMSSPSDMSDD